MARCNSMLVRQKIRHPPLVLEYKMQRYCWLLALLLVSARAETQDTIDDGVDHVLNTPASSAYRVPPIIYLAPSNIIQQPQTTIYLHPQSRYRKQGEVIVIPRNVLPPHKRPPYGFSNDEWQPQGSIESSHGQDNTTHPAQPTRSHGR